MFLFAIFPFFCHQESSKDGYNIILQIMQVQAEGDQFKDIVLVQVGESYYNITYQTLEIFKILTVDRRVTHVMKVDDDSYVRMESLSKFLRGNQGSFKGTETFAGNLEHISGPIRDVNSKWYMGHSDWPYNYYPTWAHGAGYILSANLARAIGNGGAALSMQGKILHLEDVSTGIWIDYVKRTLKKDVEMVHDARLGLLLRVRIGVYHFASNYFFPNLPQVQFFSILHGY